MPTNLVSNPSFETGNFNSWTVTDPDPNNPDIGVDNAPEDVESGTYGVYSGAGNSAATLSQTITTVVGHVYDISFYLDVYQNAAIDGSFKATFGGHTAVSLTEPAETDSFTEYTAQITATSTSSALQFSFLDPGGYFGFDNVSVTDSGPCYVRGTRILTAAGEVAVERLQIGDLVVTVSGALRPIRWIGYRDVACRRHPNRQEVWPIRIRAGAIAPGVPVRDLCVSPEHNIYFDRVLIPAKLLVNDLTIIQEEVARVSYWHIELATHDCLYAEGLAAESFLDCNNRRAFANCGAVADLHPDFRAKSRGSERIWAELGFAPRCLDGQRLLAIKAALALRAKSYGLTMTADPDVRLVADGAPLTPTTAENGDWIYAVPPGARRLRLQSRSAVPRNSHTSLNQDPRRLGVAVRRLEIDGRPINLSANALADGWNKAEGAAYRWTNGDAALPLGRSVKLKFDPLSEQYPTDPPHISAALSA